MPGAVLETSQTGVVTRGTPSALQESDRTPRVPGPANNNPGAKGACGDPRTGKYLTFLLAREEFAIQVLKVREIMGIQEITAVPQTPSYVKGVINLRGKVIPVVDLRLKFCLPEAEYTQRTCIIVVQLHSGDASLLTGIIVDEVAEVLNLAAGDIEDTPDFGEGADYAASYLLGMAKVKGKVKILLDIGRVLSSHEAQDWNGLLQQEQREG